MLQLLYNHQSVPMNAEPETRLLEWFFARMLGETASFGDVEVFRDRSRPTQVPNILVIIYVLVLEMNGISPLFQFIFIVVMIYRDDVFFLV